MQLGMIGLGRMGSTWYVGCCATVSTNASSKTGMLRT